jgi:hypothetical protein
VSGRDNSFQMNVARQSSVVILQSVNHWRRKHSLRNQRGLWLHHHLERSFSLPTSTTADKILGRRYVSGRDIAWEGLIIQLYSLTAGAGA